MAAKAKKTQHKTAKPRTHLAILKKPYLDAVLNGQKTIESRLYKLKTAPVGNIAPGDIIIFKQSCGPIRAFAHAGRVMQVENPTKAELTALYRKYDRYVMAGRNHWLAKHPLRYALLIWLKRVTPVAPFDIDKTDRRSWVILQNGRDFGLAKKIPANLTI
jgi:ASC-1-like (ASCH) protein